MPAFGRKPYFDERSREFPVAVRAMGRPPKTRAWSVPYVLDQGNEGACVGFGIAHELAADPVAVPGLSASVARTIYHEAQRLDPWKGGSYPGADPFYEGTAVLAGCKAAVKLGFAKGYTWAFGIHDLLSGVCHVAPAVIGVDWYEGMADPDKSGIIRPTGRVTGGHCVCVIGYSTRTKRFMIQNSWGKDWGDKGRAWIHVDDMAKLLKAQGEAVFLHDKLGGNE